MTNKRRRNFLVQTKFDKGVTTDVSNSSDQEHRHCHWICKIPNRAIRELWTQPINKYTLGVSGERLRPSASTPIAAASISISCRYVRTAVRTCRKPICGHFSTFILNEYYSENLKFFFTISVHQTFIRTTSIGGYSWRWIKNFSFQRFSLGRLDFSALPSFTGMGSLEFIE